MKKFGTLMMVLVLASFSVGFSHQSQLLSRRKTSWDHFGTVSSVVVYDDFRSTDAVAKFDNVWQQIHDTLTKLENTLSVAKVDSDIYRFNNARYGESMPVSNLTAKMVRMAQEVYELTDGAYNPAVKHLVDLWGFSPRFSSRDAQRSKPYDRPRNANGGFNLPDPRYVQAFVALADFSGVLLSGDEHSGYQLTKTVQDIEIDGVLYSLSIDLGGIVKGHAAVLAGEILQDAGYEYGFVSIGMSSMQLLKRNVSAEGAPQDHMWAVHMSSPHNRAERFITAFGKNAGVSTSGSYYNRYIVDGIEYSHIINPITGKPTTSQVLSVTIIGGDAAYIDAITTALCVMDVETAIDFMNTHLTDYLVAIIISAGDELKLITNMTPEQYTQSSY